MQTADVTGASFILAELDRVWMATTGGPESELPPSFSTFFSSIRKHESSDNDKEKLRGFSFRELIVVIATSQHVLNCSPPSTTTTIILRGKNRY